MGSLRLFFLWRARLHSDTNSCSFSFSFVSRVFLCFQSFSGAKIRKNLPVLLQSVLPGTSFAQKLGKEPEDIVFWTDFDSHRGQERVYYWEMSLIRVLLGLRYYYIWNGTAQLFPLNNTSYFSIDIKIFDSLNYCQPQNLTHYLRNKKMNYVSSLPTKWVSSLQILQYFIIILMLFLFN